MKEWINDVKRALNERGMSMEQKRVLVCDGSEWRDDVNA